MAESCIHFNCKFCGSQVRCIDVPLQPGGVLTCSSGHSYEPNEEEREKINLAFKGFIDTRIDVML